MEKEKNIDWRIEYYVGELNGAEFQLKKFVSTAPNDHEHCYFCWQKITDLNIDNADKEGYCTHIVNTETARAEWICKKCFNDFYKQFDFKLKNNT